MTTDLRGAEGNRDAGKFLDELNGGPLTFSQMMESFRLCDEMSLVDYAGRLGVSRQYLCDVEKGRRTVSLARAAEWGRILGYGEELFMKLALEQQARAAGLDVEITVKSTPKTRRKPRRDDGTTAKKRASRK